MNVINSASNASLVYSTNYCICLGVVGAAASLIAAGFGLSQTALLAGHPSIALVNTVALAVMVWPVIALTVRRLHERRAGHLWGMALLPLAVTAIMAVHFGKPAVLIAAHGPLQAVPTMLSAMLAAWIVSEWSYDRIVARTGVQATGSRAPAMA